MNDQSCDDAELIPDVAHRDFDDFFIHYAREVAAIVALTTRDVGLAEDATQEAMTCAYQRWDRVGGLERPDLWVIGVATRLAIDGWRKRRREVALSGDAGPMASEDMLRSMLVRWDLELLPSKERVLLILRHGDGLSNEEIGRLTGKSPNTIAIYLKRARRRLRALLSERNRE